MALHRRRSRGRPERGRASPGRRRGARAVVLLALAAAAAMPTAGAATEGPPVSPDTRRVMFVGNNWDGTADIIDPRTFERLGRINTIPDKQARLAEINSNPDRLGVFLGVP